MWSLLSSARILIITLHKKMQTALPALCIVSTEEGNLHPQVGGGAVLVLDGYTFIQGLQQQGKKKAQTTVTLGRLTYKLCESPCPPFSVLFHFITLQTPLPWYCSRRGEVSRGSLPPAVPLEPSTSSDFIRINTTSAKKRAVTFVL